MERKRQRGGSEGKRQREETGWKRQRGRNRGSETDRGEATEGETY